MSVTGNVPRPLLAVLVIAAMAMGGCSRVPPLTNTSDTADALVTQVLAALAARDRTRLAALAIDETEFRDHVWKLLPASRPERNLPMSYVWGDLHQKSQASLSRTLAALGGQRATLVSVAFDGAPQPYGPLVIHEGTRLTVRMADGAEQQIRVCGSLAEMDGRWKVFSYVVDD